MKRGSYKRASFYLEKKIMNQSNYIKCNDPETITKLKRLGFPVLSEEKNGFVTFLNNPKWTKDFTAEDKVMFTNRINL